MVPSSSLKVHYGDEPFISHAVLTELCKMVNARFETERHTWGPSLASRIWSNSLTYSTQPSLVRLKSLVRNSVCRTNIFHSMKRFSTKPCLRNPWCVFDGKVWHETLSTELFDEKVWYDTLSAKPMVCIG